MRQIYLFLLLTFVLFASDAEYYIITETDYLPSAEIMQLLHSSEVEPDLQLYTEVFSTSYIAENYHDFEQSEAIRNFVLDSLAVNPNLKYLLLIGDETVVPPIFDWYGNPSDDFYSSENPIQAYPQIGTGRIPVSNPEDALAVANKIRSFTLNWDNGPWRSKFILLADDAHKAGANSPYFETEVTHVANSDMIYNIIGQDLDVSCLYGTDYVRDWSAGDWPTLPQLTQDLIAALNSGVGWLNYIGHGNETTLADELILQEVRDLDFIHPPQDKQPVWVIGSCGFGHYDNADCMSESLLLKPEGAIALITPTRDLFVEVVEQFANRLYSHVYDYMHGLNDYRIGDLVRISKSGGLDYHYHLMGDPAMMLPFPKTTELLSEIPPDIQLLNETEINLLPAYSALEANVKVKGPEQEITRVYSTWGPTVTLEYTLPGPLVYDGDFTGSTSFVTPLDMPFCDDCSASIHLYADAQSPTGLSQSVWAIPILEPSGDSQDNTGPQISVLYENEILEANDVLSTPSDIIIEFSDESGINLMGALGHEIRYWLDHEENAFTITSQFSYNFGVNTTGIIPIQIDQTVTGLHVLHVEAWDNANNRSLFSLPLCFNDCSPPQDIQEYYWTELTSLLTPTGIFFYDENRIFASTTGGILDLNINDAEFSFIQGDEGLVNLQISAMITGDYNNLWLGSNSGLQLFHPEFGSQRSISHLDIDNIFYLDAGSDRAFAAYLAGTQYGIIEFRFDENNLPYYQNSYANFPLQITGVLDIDHLSGMLYVTTPQGLFVGDYENSLLTSSSNWTLAFDGLKRFVPTGSEIGINDNEIWQIDETDHIWDLVYSGLSGSLVDAFYDEMRERLCILTTTRYYEFNSDFEISDGFPYIIPESTTFTSVSRLENQLAFGLSKYGIAVFNESSGVWSTFVPNTLERNEYNALTVTADGSLAGASKRSAFHYSDDTAVNLINNYIANSYYLDDFSPLNFSGMSMEYMRPSNIPWSMAESETGQLLFSNSGLVPNNPGYAGGVIQFDPITYNYTVWDTTDGILDGLAGVYNQNWTNTYLTIHQIIKDPYGNLWVVNPYSERFNHIAAIQMADGITWNHVTAPDNTSYLPQEVTFDRFGRAWFGLRWDIPINDNIGDFADGGIKVIDTRGTLNDESDDIWIPILNLEILPDISVWSVCFDKHDILWILTSNGVQAYDYEENDAGILLLPLSDFPFLSHLPLFKGDHIRVDSDNNKWVSTKGSGIYVILRDMSLWPDGNGLTSDNSKLLSDTVFDIAIDDINQTVYFSTENGISGFDMTQIPDVPVVVNGDINDDGQLFVDDIVIVILITLEMLSPDGFYVEAADMDQNGLLEIEDALWILEDILEINRSEEVSISQVEFVLSNNRLQFFADADIAAIQLLVEGDYRIVQQNGVEVLSNERKVTAISMDRTRLNEVPILEFTGSFLVKSAVVCDWTGVCSEFIESPKFYTISEPYPNPFNPIVNIDFSLQKSIHMNIGVYDIKGRQVQILENKTFNPGDYQVRWNAQNAASGLYFIRISGLDDNYTRKILLLK